MMRDQPITRWLMMCDQPPLTIIIGKVQTLDWTTGMDHWTGIFWFLISFFTFFDTYFVENHCLFSIFRFKLECWCWLMPMLAVLKEINYSHNWWIHSKTKFSWAGCWLHVRVNLLLPYWQLKTYISASVIITSFL